MYAVARVINVVLIAIAAIFAIFTGDYPWMWILAAIVLTVAAPANYFLAKNILLSKSISVKANVRKFAKRRMETAGFWFPIGATVLSHGIIKTFYTGNNAWIPFIPVGVLIVGWAVASYNRFDPNKYDKEETQKKA
jgi:hypothetical protein